MIKLALFFLLFSFSFHGIADDYSQQELADGYKSAQGVLKDKKQRNEVIQKDAKAKKSDEFVDQVVHGDETKKEKMYDISADIVNNFSSKSPEEANRILADATKNPEAFFNSLTPEQKKSIQDLAKTLEPAKASSASKP